MEVVAGRSTTVLGGRCTGADGWSLRDTVGVPVVYTYVPDISAESQPEGANIEIP